MNEGIFLSLGSNMGDRAANLANAVQSLHAIGEIKQQSSIYQTDAWGNTNQPAFFNQVIEIRTSLDPEALLNTLLQIEIQLGRIRDERWGPRIIDIDLLFYGNKSLQQKNLNVPHPGVPLRRFVLAPMAEISPLFIHPLLNKSIAELLNKCTDPLRAEKIVE